MSSDLLIDVTSKRKRCVECDRLSGWGEWLCKHPRLSAPTKACGGRLVPDGAKEGVLALKGKNHMVLVKNDRDVEVVVDIEPFERVRLAPRAQATIPMADGQTLLIRVNDEGVRVCGKQYAETQQDLDEFLARVEG
jgi:hypothetical protein